MRIGAIAVWMELTLVELNLKIIIFASVVVRYSPIVITAQIICCVFIFALNVNPKSLPTIERIRLADVCRCVECETSSFSFSSDESKSHSLAINSHWIEKNIHPVKRIYIIVNMQFLPVRNSLNRYCPNKILRNRLCYYYLHAGIDTIRMGNK